MKQKSDFLFLGILAILSFVSVYNWRFNGYELFLNNYLAFTLLPVVFILRLLNNKAGTYGVAALLILGTLSILNYLPATVSFRFAAGNIVLIGFNPVIGLFVALYYFANKKLINSILSSFFNGSDKDRQEEHQKKIDFYLKTFGNLTAAELEYAHQKIKEYPPEAQAALKKIMLQKQSIQE